MAALIEELKACEIAVWEALKRGDAEADAAALAPDFLGVYADGFAGRACHVGQLADGPSIAAYDLSDFHLLVLSDDHALISYRANFQRTGPEAIPESMYVSSIWQRTPDGWINIFSQDTPEAR
ncbi:DUF4440 domain-containing protein [Hoeflea sp.]|uniref:DUF4440 domain-containing protein n=1 Tax=Hoeflea sp. TaxID=1940281 RepID=UPI003B01B680